MNKYSKNANMNPTLQKMKPSIVYMFPLSEDNRDRQMFNMNQINKSTRHGI